MGRTISYSSELMDNFLLFEEAVIDNTSRFEALQTADGHSLLFSLGSDKRFYLMQEKAGEKTGWVKHLLFEQIQISLFHGGNIDIKTFDVRQNDASGAINIAAIVTADGKDHLVVARNIANTDATWDHTLAWHTVPFDDVVNHKVVMTNVFMGYSDDEPLLVVDVLRDPSNSLGLLERYYVQPEAAKGKWRKHSVSVDIEAQKTTDVFGRATDEDVDGIYTLGALADRSLLIYHPLYNTYNEQTRPTPVRLYLPTADPITAIATTRLGDTEATDLFAIGGKTLFYFAADKQADADRATKLLENDIFLGAKTLYAATHNGKVTLWGVNGQREMFYLTCVADQVETASAWSYPLPIVTNAHQIAPYVNNKGGINTFFVHTGGKNVVKMEQAADTSLWNSSRISLPAASSTPATMVKSFTTQINVTDDNGNPLSDAEVKLTTATRKGFYINNEYTVLDGTPTTVRTAPDGSIAVIEAVDSIEGELITILGLDGREAFQIDPNAKVIGKLKELSTAEKLKSANVSDDNGNTTGTLMAGASEAQLQQVANAISGLTTAANAPKTRSLAQAQSDAAPQVIASFSVRNNDEAVLTRGLFDTIWTTIGDGLRVLKNAVESAANYAFELVKRAGESVYEFAVTIGGKILKFVVEGAKAVARACVAVFEAVKTAAEKVWQFLKVLFNWKDIKQTKELIKQLVIFQTDMIVHGFANMKASVHNEIQQLRDSIQSIRHNMQGKSATAAKQKGAEDSKKIQASANSSESSFLKNHLKNNGANSTSASEAPAGPTVDENAFPQSDASLLDELKGLCSDLYTQLTSSESFDFNVILARLLGVLDAVIGLMQSGVDWLFDKLMDVISTLLTILDTPLRVPVLSDILEKYLGIPSFSLLDIIAYVIALPATILYKLVSGGKAPVDPNEKGIQELLAYKQGDLLKAPQPVATRSIDPETQQSRGLAGQTMMYVEKSGKILGMSLPWISKMSFQAKKALFLICRMIDLVIRIVQLFVDPIQLTVKVASEGLIKPMEGLIKGLKYVRFAISRIASTLFSVKYGTWFDSVVKVTSAVLLVVDFLVIVGGWLIKKFLTPAASWMFDKGLAVVKAGVGIIKALLAIVHIVHIPLYATDVATGVATLARGTTRISDAVRNVAVAVYMIAKEPVTMATALTTLTVAYAVSAATIAVEAVGFVMIADDNIAKLP